MKKTANLKKRLDDLRGEPAPPVEVVLHLEADLYRQIMTLAAGERFSLEAYIVQVLSRHAEMTGDNGDE